MTTYLQILLPSAQVKNGTSENCLPWKKIHKHEEQGETGMIGSGSHMDTRILAFFHTVNSNRMLLWGFPQLKNNNKPEHGGKTLRMMD